MKASENSKETPKKGAKKNSLVNNINAKKKAGTSKSKNDSTVSDKDYHDMQKDWKDKD
jgi:hypothetical protein